MQPLKIELFVKCLNLQNKDLLSKSDPYFVIKIKSTQPELYDSLTSNTFIEIFRSKVIQDSLNPDFPDSFIIDYYFH